MVQAVCSCLGVRKGNKYFFFFSSRRRHTRLTYDWSSDVCSSDLAAYGFVDHVVVFATTSVQIHEIIDTDQGRAAKLVDSSDFKATLAALPADRLGYLYVNGR